VKKNRMPGGRTPTPREIREREEFAVWARLRGEDKDFFAVLLEEKQAEFRATAADVVTILLRGERERRQTMGA
jgi:hypothetical protein